MIGLRYLPTINFDEKQVQLPCPESEMVRLALALSQPIGLIGSADRVTSVLFDAPELLLFALHHFYRTTEEPPQHLAELGKWFSHFFEEEYRHWPQGWSLICNDIWNAEQTVRYSQARAAFVLPTSNKKLKKSLRALVRNIPGFKKKTARNWIEKIIGEQFDLKIEKPSGDLDDFESIFKLSHATQECRNEFEARLLHEKLLSMKQLAYGASHEINNPLANIATRAQSLLVDEQHPERRRKLAVVYEQAMRAHEMISDMMLFAHPPEIKLQLVDVYDVARQVLSEMRLDIRQRNATADIRRYPNTEKIWMDPTQISVAIKALVRNSLESIEAKPTDEPGRIIVRIWPEGGDLAISVADNGAGLTSAAKKHLFDPFFSGREAGRGLGFGLSKAWRISQLHEGNLVFDKDYQGGTQFILSLPINRKMPTARIDNTSAA